MEQVDGPPGGPGAVLSFLREGAPAEVSESQVHLPASTIGVGADGLGTRCRAFMHWLTAQGFLVVVFDMDKTMSRGHCGQVNVTLRSY